MELWKSNMAEEQTTQILQPNDKVVNPDLRELDIDALENYIAEQYRDSQDPLGDRFRTQLYLREYPGTKVVVTEYGMSIDNDSFYKKAVDEAKYQAGDIGKGVRIGVNRAVEGLGLIPVSLAEALNIASDGAVERFEAAFDEIYAEIGETETALGKVASIGTQYVVPGGIAVKGMNRILSNTATRETVKRMIAGEALTIGAVSLPEDSNLVDMIMTGTGLDKSKAESVAREMFNYIATPETEKDPASILESKLKNIIGDVMILGPTFRMVKEFGDTIKAAKKNPEIKDELIGILSEQAVEGEM